MEFFPIYLNIENHNHHIDLQAKSSPYKVFDINVF